MITFLKVLNNKKYAILKIVIFDQNSIHWVAWTIVNVTVCVYIVYPFSSKMCKGEDGRVKYNGRAIQKCPENLEEASCDVFSTLIPKYPNHTSSRSNGQKIVFVM